MAKIRDGTRDDVDQLPRGKYLGRPVGHIADESEHFMRCDCGGWIDCQDLSAILDHDGPLPHPGEDQPQ
jgi:hypothetical protein